MNAATVLALSGNGRSLRRIHRSMSTNTRAIGATPDLRGAAEPNHCAAWPSLCSPSPRLSRVTRRKNSRSGTSCTRPASATWARNVTSEESDGAISVVASRSTSVRITPKHGLHSQRCAAKARMRRHGSGNGRCMPSRWSPMGSPASSISRVPP